MTNRMLKNVRDDFKLARTLTTPEEGEIILQLRKVIPPVPCKKDCVSCCLGVGDKLIHFFSTWELNQLPKYPHTTISGNCPFISEAGCAIYQHRPLTCRLYGTTKGSWLDCQKGLAPDPPLPTKTFHTIQRFIYVAWARRQPPSKRKLLEQRIRRFIKGQESPSSYQKQLMEMWK